MKGRIKYFIGAALIAISGIAAILIYAWFPGISLERALARKGLSVEDLNNDRNKVLIRIFKEDKRLEIFYRDEVVKTYRAVTGPGIPKGSKPPGSISKRELFFRSFWYHPGDKEVRGDLRTPEGKYHLVYDFRNSADHYRFALISYPDAAHRKRSKNPGGAVGIHGIGHGLNRFGRLHIWVRHTRGCISLNNNEIDELDMVVGKGTKVEILP
jgi:murein L,D-transpeptidase YafK